MRLLDWLPELMTVRRFSPGASVSSTAMAASMTP